MSETIRPPLTLTRRTILTGAGAGAFALAMPFPALGETEDADRAIRDLFGDGELNEGRVTVKVPPIAENGNSVSISVSVDSPMTDADHVKRIAIISPRNPIATVANFELGPRAGKAAVSTRIRMAGTQRIRAVAEMSDGSLWVGSASTVVTLAACIVG